MARAQLQWQASIAASIAGPPVIGGYNGGRALPYRGDPVVEMVIDYSLCVQIRSAPLNPVNESSKRIQQANPASESSKRIQQANPAGESKPNPADYSGRPGDLSC